MKVHDLKPAPGSTRPRRRVGRGIAGKGGKTAGRGTKGQGRARQHQAGVRGWPAAPQAANPEAEGLQEPLPCRVQRDQPGHPRGFEGDVVSPETLRAKGLVHKHGLVKVLGRGELTRRLQVSAHAFSRSATAAIEASGGSVEVLPPPFGNGRPPAKGNALTNR